MKTKRFLPLVFLFLWSFSFISCSNQSYQECMNNIIETKLEKILHNQQENCVVFFADNQEEHYEIINRFCNLYFCKNKNIPFYKIAIQNITNTNQYLTMIQNVYPSITSLSNATALFHSGKIYRGYDGTLMDNITKKQSNYFASYIEGIDSFTPTISFTYDETITNLFVVSSEEIEQMITNKESFLLFAGQNGCGSCENCKIQIKKEIANDHFPIYYADSLTISGIKIEFTPTFLTFQEGLIKNYYLGCYPARQLKKIFIKKVI